MSVRLQKILSAAGVASRRAAERLIQEGRVSVNGATVLDLGAKADPSSDVVRVDGQRVTSAAPPRYILLNKPTGVVTTRSDPQRRPTVLALLPGVREYVYPVGRLDYDTEGLLLLTNDGELAARLTHPRHGVPKIYRARVRGVPDQRALDRLGRGIVLDGRRTAPAGVRLVKRLDTPGGGGAILEITLREGRNRQVRRMCDAVGHPVRTLARIAFGPLRDARLPSGQHRELTPQEVSRLKAAVGLPPSPPRTRTGSDSTRPSRPPAGPLRRG